MSDVDETAPVVAEDVELKESELLNVKTKMFGHTANLKSQLFDAMCVLLFDAIDTGHDDFINQTECLKFLHHDGCLECIKAVVPDITSHEDACTHFLGDEEKASKA